MALSEAEGSAIENRFLALESKVNDLQTAINNLATKAQLISLLNIRQAEIDSLTDQVGQLEVVDGSIQLVVHEADLDAHDGILASHVGDENAHATLLNVKSDTSHETDVPTHNVAAGAHTALFTAHEDDTATHSGLFVTHNADGSAHSALFATKSDTSHGHATHVLIDGSRAMDKLGIGGVPATDVQLDLQQTDGAFLPPRLASAQVVALTPIDGMVLHDTVSGLQGYFNNAWRKLDQNFEPFADILIPAGTTQTIDFSTGRNQVVDLVSASGDVTLTLSNPQSGFIYTVKFIQGATPRDAVWPGNVKWSGGTPPVISTTDDDEDIIQLLYDGTNYSGIFIQELL